MADMDLPDLLSEVTRLRAEAAALREQRDRLVEAAKHMLWAASESLPDEWTASHDKLKAALAAVEEARG